jgi:hypothetical protein
VFPLLKDSHSPYDLILFFTDFRLWLLFYIVIFKSLKQVTISPSRWSKTCLLASLIFPWICTILSQSSVYFLRFLNSYLALNFVLLNAVLFGLIWFVFIILIAVCYFLYFFIFLSRMFIIFLAIFVLLRLFTQKRWYFFFYVSSLALFLSIYHNFLFYFSWLVNQAPIINFEILLVVSLSEVDWFVLIARRKRMEAQDFNTVNIDQRIMGA